MGIGRWRHRVTFKDAQDPNAVFDPASWDCDIESSASQVVDGLTPFFVTGRYHPGITLNTQLVTDEQLLQVQAITDPGRLHKTLILSCVEVVGRG